MANVAYRLVGAGWRWLALVGWLQGQCIRLPGCLAAWLPGCLAAWLPGWLAGRLASSILLHCNMLHCNMGGLGLALAVSVRAASTNNFYF